MLETPWLLINWKEDDYLNKFRDHFVDKIILPDDNKDVVIYSKDDKSVYHIWRWWWYEWLREDEFNFDDPKFYRRAQRILWIKYILENKNIRSSFFDKKNKTICLICRELEYTVVIQKIKNTHYKLVTAFHTFRAYRYDTDDRFSKYDFT